MKKTLLLLPALVVCSFSAHAKLNVVTTLPDFGWLAREIGKPGRVQASQGIHLMNVPANVTRAAGDVHALGNPHFTVDPIIAKAIAQHIAQSFSALDPANAAFYEANYKKFEATINAKLQEWGTALLPFKGQHVVAYHDSWPYFAHRFGVNIDIFLEPEPGIAS